MMSEETAKLLDRTQLALEATTDAIIHIQEELETTFNVHMDLLYGLEHLKSSEFGPADDKK